MLFWHFQLYSIVEVEIQERQMRILYATKGSDRYSESRPLLYGLSLDTCCALYLMSFVSLSLTPLFSCHVLALQKVDLQGGGKELVPYLRNAE